MLICVDIHSKNIIGIHLFNSVYFFGKRGKLYYGTTSWPEMG